MNKLRHYIAATVTRHTRHRYITVLSTLLDDHASVKDDRFWLFSGSASESAGPDPTQLSTVNKRTCHKTWGCLCVSVINVGGLRAWCRDDCEAPAGVMKFRQIAEPTAVTSKKYENRADHFSMFPL